MADSLEGVTQQTDLVLWRGGGSHAVGRSLGVVVVVSLAAIVCMASTPLASRRADEILQPEIGRFRVREWGDSCQNQCFNRNDRGNWNRKSAVLEWRGCQQRKTGFDSDNVNSCGNKAGRLNGKYKLQGRFKATTASSINTLTVGTGNGLGLIIQS